MTNSTQKALLAMCTVWMTTTTAQTTHTVTLNANQPPALVVDAGGFVVANDPTVNFFPVLGGTPTAQGGTAPYTYYWTDVFGTPIGQHLNIDSIANPILDYNSFVNELFRDFVRVTVTDANGCSETDILGVFFIGSVESLAAQRLNLYPNPASEMVTVSVMYPNGTLYITDMKGVTVMQVAISAFVTDLQLSALPKGAYFMTFETETTIQNAKLILQ